jgi:hypothetical protein
MQNKWKILHIRQVLFTSAFLESIGVILGATMTCATNSSSPSFDITCDDFSQQMITESVSDDPFLAVLPTFTRAYSDTNPQLIPFHSLKQAPFGFHWMIVL